MKKIAIYLVIGACSCRQPSEIIFSAKVNDVTTHYRDDTVRYIYQRRDPGAEFHISLENPGDKSFSVSVKHYGRTALSDSCSFWVYYNHGYDSVELFSASCKNCADRITVNPNDSVPIILHTEFLDFVKVIGSYSSPKEVDDKIDEIVKGWSAIKYLDHNGKQIFFIPRESVAP